MSEGRTRQVGEQGPGYRGSQPGSGEEPLDRLRRHFATLRRGAARGRAHARSGIGFELEKGPDTTAAQLTFQPAPERIHGEGGVSPSGVAEGGALTGEEVAGDRVGEARGERVLVVKGGVNE